MEDGDMRESGADVFSIEESFGEGWKVFKEKAGFVLGLELFVLAFSFLAGLIQRGAGSRWLAIAVGLFFGVAKAFLSLGANRVSLKLVAGAETTFFDLFGEGKKVFSYLLASFIVTVGTLIGLVLLVVPGIIFGLGVSPFVFVVLDKDLGPVDALFEAWRLTQGSKGKLFLFFLALGLLNLAGTLCLFVGLLVSIPVSGLAAAAVYRKLKAAAPGAQFE